MGLRQQGKARQGSGRWRRSTRGRSPRLPTQTKRRRRKKHNACPTVPCACPLPLAPCTLSLAPCPSPEATHNKDELKNDVTSNQRAERVWVRAAVGLAVLTEKEKKKTSPKKTTKKERKKPSSPAPWALPHTSPRSYPRPTQLPLKDSKMFNASGRRGRGVQGEGERAAGR